MATVAVMIRFMHRPSQLIANKLNTV